jgi:Zn-dependent protease with chaperone function
VISNALGRLLERDEMEAAISHELAHVKSGDSDINVLFAVYRRILFFEPALRSLESRFHREREFAADEFSAFFTRKSLSRASALLKISRHQGVGPGNLAVVSVVGVGWYQNGPQLKERVMRFVRIADHLEFINLRTRSRFSESRRSLVSGSTPPPSATRNAIKTGANGRFDRIA